MTLGEVVPDHWRIQGLKPENRPIRAAVLCFLPNHPHKDHQAYAARSSAQPWVLTVCVGGEADPRFARRVTNLVRLSNVFGATAELAPPDARDRLAARWPQAIALHDVWEIRDPPRLEDLGVARSMFARRHSHISGSPEAIAATWTALAGYRADLVKVERNISLFDPGTPGPPRGATAEEGRAAVRLARRYERSGTLAKECRRLNRAANGGVLACEGCGFTDTANALFDVHHLRPLHVGPCTTTLHDLALLCATCHRWAHHKPGPAPEPLAIEALRIARLLAKR